ncbi:MAG: SMC-Scp complex subunit ScpB [Chloroflexi bacterium]|nr:SMC-Scp complex subunit ScpB [Chloroflexota bacterium]
MRRDPGPAEAGLASAIESILLVAGEPVAVSALARTLGQRADQVVAACEELRRELQGGIRLQLHEGRAQLVTAPENAELVQRFLGAVKPAPLSRPALETLTIVAYRQPVTRSEIEAARGVNSDRALQTLLARGLVEERGQRRSLGRPMEYGTSFGFLEYFGLQSLADLPPLEEAEPPRAPPVTLGMR